MTAAYLLRRVAHGLAVVLGVGTLVFVTTHLLADPARKALPLDASPAQVERFRAEFGLDRPIVEQFGGFLADTARLDFGTSITRRVPAADIVLDRLPPTLLLMAAGLTLSLLIAFPLGILAAMWPGSRVDNLTVTISLIGLSLPQFWLGALLILVFAVQLGLVPTSGIGGFKHLILPAITLALPVAGRVAQMVRTTVIDELQRPYVLAARARGLGYVWILSRHVLRNASVPIVSYISFQTASAFAGGTVLVETVFAYPGLGYLAVEAARRDDIVLIQACVIAVTLLVVVTNIAFDLLQGWIDPRVRHAR